MESVNAAHSILGNESKNASIIGANNFRCSMALGADLHYGYDVEKLRMEALKIEAEERQLKLESLENRTFCTT